MFVEPEQVEEGPVMVDEGPEMTLTSFVQVELQPEPQLPVVVVSVNVNEPAAPAVTFTDDPVVQPTIEPFPEIDQAYVKPEGPV